MRDDIYQGKQTETGSFRFDASVVEVFDDMIRRSVPGYGLTLEMIGVIARQAFRGQNEGDAYDLGCSLGASMFPILQESSARVHGVDLSPQMLSQAREHLAGYAERITLTEADLSQYQFPTSARLIVSNFTLQFLPLESRLSLLQRAYESLEPGGILLLSEKFSPEESAERALLTELHHTFKSSMGYSDLEIARKRDAIENVLIPESSESHLQRLRDLGFQTPVCWYQCFNFGSFLAIKE